MRTLGIHEVADVFTKNGYDCQIGAENRQVEVCGVVAQHQQCLTVILESNGILQFLLPLPFRLSPACLGEAYRAVGRINAELPLQGFVVNESSGSVAFRTAAMASGLSESLLLDVAETCIQTAEKYVGTLVEACVQRQPLTRTRAVLRVRPDGEELAAIELRESGEICFDFLGTGEFQTWLDTFGEPVLAATAEPAHPRLASTLADLGFSAPSRIFLVERRLDPVAQSVQSELQQVPASLAIEAFVRRAGTDETNANGLYANLFPQIIEQARRADEDQTERSWWRIWTVEGQAAGAVLLHGGGNYGETGGLEFIGVAPEWRGKGIGSQLHRAALAELAALGCRIYLDATDAENRGMQLIFFRNGCHVTEKVEVRWLKKQSR